MPAARLFKSSWTWKCLSLVFELLRQLQHALSEHLSDPIGMSNIVRMLEFIQKYHDCLCTDVGVGILRKLFLKTTLGTNCGHPAVLQTLHTAVATRGRKILFIKSLRKP